MNWLLEQLPDKVLVDGTEYLVDSDFRAILLIDQIMHDKELSDTQRVISALTIFYGDNPPKQTTQAIEKLVWFFRCGKNRVSRKNAEDAFEDIPEQLITA